MIRTVTAFAAATLMLTAAAYAGTPTSTAASPLPAKNASAHPATALTYNSESAPMAAFADPNVPGATGRAIVPGNNSTIAGDALATRMERTGAYGQ